MFNQTPPNQEVRSVIQAAAGLSTDQSDLLGKFLQGKCRPPDWPEDYWEYLQSGEASFVELEHILELRLAFGEPFLKAIKMTDGEQCEGLSAWLILDAMTDLARALFGYEMVMMHYNRCERGRSFYGLSLPHSGPSYLQVTTNAPESSGHTDWSVFYFRWFRSEAIRVGRVRC